MDSNTNTCDFLSCDRPVFVKKTKHGKLCNGHYAQYKKGKSLKPLRPYKERVVTGEESICPEEGCERPSWHKSGYCQSHKRQKYSGQSLRKIREYKFQKGSTCSKYGCEKIAKSKGFCSTHYRSGPCEHPGCTRKMYHKKTRLCSKHHDLRIASPIPQGEN